MDIKKAVNEVIAQVTEWRHIVHQNPELANEEFKTSALVEKALTEAGIEVTRFPNSTAVMGVLKGGKPGKTIALRADMDALPIKELTDVSYKSQNEGVMHACGHDIHTTVLMGAATALAKYRDEVPGTVKFLFQPAEEVPPGGALGMVANNVLKNPDAEYVFALHTSVSKPIGTVEINNGYSHANTDGCTITINAKGAHGAYPHLGVDAVAVAGHVIVGLHSIVSRSVNPIDSGVVTVGSMHSGTVNNIIAETAEMKLTVRTLTPETRELLKKRIIEVAEHTALAHGATATVDYWYGYPSVYNDKKAVEIVKATAEKHLPADKIYNRELPGMGGEDFAYFAKEVPGAFFYLGAKVDDYPGHNPRYNASDDCLATGVEMMVALVFEASK
ncbi:amidohydrolase [Clostridium sp. 'deep sea']|uniref:M20 metallopeptidase family protein n=1 Tax=Clostridium sp. 'deep sea' TaxID=2779445 RepID=UPI0018967E5A|nr:amidohydrolase [Clostridium sp. 'deep sea']QOR36587.1 amidohydrolase [Clostridium sp. 'deep sea']